MVGDSAGIRISVGISSGLLLACLLVRARKCAICSSMLVVMSSLGLAGMLWCVAGSTRTTQHSSGAAVMCSTPRGTTWKSPSRKRDIGTVAIADDERALAHQEELILVGMRYARRTRP